MLDHFVWTGIFLGLPAVVLVIAFTRLVRHTYRQWHAGHWQALMSVGLIVTVMALLFTRFINEKLILVIALLCWAYLAVWILRQVLGVRPTDHFPVATAEDPHSLNFSGVDRGFQGFGIYVNGTRVGNDPIDDDTP